MKKKRFACLALIAPLALLTACAAAPEFSYQSNWLANTGLNSIPDGFHETLVYDVTFVKNEKVTGDFGITYSGGVYRTELMAVNREIGGTLTTIYRYTTSLSVQAQYSYGETKSEVFTDTVQSSVEFLGVRGALAPLNSEKTVHASAPLLAPDGKFTEMAEGKAYALSHYRTEITYLEKSAAVKTTDLSVENAEPVEYTLSTKGKTPLFDNEQIAVLLRAIPLSSNLSFRSVEPETRSVETVKFKSGPTGREIRRTFTAYGSEEERTVPVYAVGIGYDKTNSGAIKTFVLAQKLLANDNTYRNAPIQYEMPVMYSHGTLLYELKVANFG